MIKENVTSAALLIFMAVAAYQDWKEKQINVCIFLVAAFVGIVLRVGVQEESVWSMLEGVAVGIVILLLAWLTGGSVGAGDGLMFMVSGIFLEFWENINLLMTSFTIAGVVALFMIAVKKKGRKYRLPFVPFMLVAYLLQLL